MSATLPIQQAPVSTSEFDVNTEMEDVEIIHVTTSRILAKGSRFGRSWLLRALPPELRGSPDALSHIRDEFDRRFSLIEPGKPMTVGIEDIKGLGPCIVEEWDEDLRVNPSRKKDIRKHKPSVRKARVLTALLILIAVSLGAGYYIRSLSVSSQAARQHLEFLRRTDRQEVEKIAELADSIDSIMRAPLIPEKFTSLPEPVKPDRNERIALALYRMRMKEFERYLERYDRQVIPRVSYDLPVFYDSIQALYIQLISRGKDVDPDGYYPQLPEDDRIRLSRQLYSGYLTRLLNYYKVWIKNVKTDDRMNKEKSHSRKDSTI